MYIMKEMWVDIVSCKVIVTGASGFLGFNLCKQLNSEGAEVYAIVRPGSKKVTELQKICTDVIECNLFEIDTLDSKLEQYGKGFDVFYHLAWEGVYGVDSRNCDIQLDNAKATCKAVEVATKLNCKTILLADSIMEYGCMKDISADGAKPGFRNIYYGAKQVAHIMAKTLCASLDIAYVEATISNIYGPGTHGFISDVLNAFLKNEEMAFSSCEQKYDFIYIDDAIKQISVVGQQGKPFSKYYIGYEPQKLKNFINIVKECTDYKKEIGFGKIKTAVIDMDVSDFDTQKISKEFGLYPQTTFREGIQKMIDWINFENNNQRGY